MMDGLTLAQAAGGVSEIRIRESERWPTALYTCPCAR